MNIMLRLQNKATLAALCATIVAFVYEILGILGIVPMIGQDQVTQAISVVITLLVALGVVVDPTTEGIADNVEAMSLDKPAANNLLTDMPSGEVLNEEETADQSVIADIDEEEE